jgi:hypothetical protein
MALAKNLARRVQDARQRTHNETSRYGFYTTMREIFSQNTAKELFFARLLSEIDSFITFDRTSNPLPSAAKKLQIPRQILNEERH